MSDRALSETLEQARRGRAGNGGSMYSCLWLLQKAMPGQSHFCVLTLLTCMLTTQVPPLVYLPSMPCLNLAL